MYAALPGVPFLMFDLLVRIPPLYHVEQAHVVTPRGHADFHAR